MSFFPGSHSVRALPRGIILLGIGILVASLIAPLAIRGDDALPIRTVAQATPPAKSGNTPAKEAAPAAARPAEAAPVGESADGFFSKSMQLLPKFLPSSLFKILQDGGLMMIPVIGCSIMTFAFGLERLVILRRRRVIPKAFVQRFISHLEQGQLDRAKALKLCEDNGSPIADVFAHAVRKWGRPAVEIEQAVIDGGERQVGHLRKNLRVLNGVYTVGPLLGLLGTVIGIMQCFNDIANSSAMGKAKQLAGGIGVALTTTAGGLAVAIPAVVLYMYFTGRIDALIVEMDQLSQKVVDLISAEALSTPLVRTPAPISAPQRARAPAPEAKRPVLG